MQIAATREGAKSDALGKGAHNHLDASSGAVSATPWTPNHVSEVRIWVSGTSGVWVARSWDVVSRLNHY